VQALATLSNCRAQEGAGNASGQFRVLGERLPTVADNWWLPFRRLSQPVGPVSQRKRGGFTHGREDDYRGIEAGNQWSKI